MTKRTHLLNSTGTKKPCESWDLEIHENKSFENPIFTGQEKEVRIKSDTHNICDFVVMDMARRKIGSRCTS